MDEVSGYLDTMVDYWMHIDTSERDRMEGIVFSVLVLFDGEAALDPPESDGELHSRWVRYCAKKGGA